MAEQARLLVAGAGSWGTALAILLARNGHACTLWGRNPERLAELQSKRENTRFLPGVELPPNLTCTSDLAAAAQNASQVLVAVPSEAFPQLLHTLRPLLASSTPVFWATKGFEPRSGRLLHRVAAEILGEKRPLAVLSGPSFAKEVAAAQPTAVTVAANDSEYARALAEYLHSDTFRVYTSDDLIGVQVGGATKNVIAIAAGIADGLKFGANARAALITRGLHECMRLGVALGGKPETFMGLAGLGDLVLTCTDNQSRNRRFGYALGRGDSADAARAAIGQVVEGTFAAAQTLQLAHQLNIEMPISEQVEGVLRGAWTPMEAVHSLLSRELKQEH